MSVPALPSPLDIAKSIRDRGWRPIPLLPRSKEPAGPWETKAASEPGDQMLTLWFGGDPRNVGVACKRSGLLVVDADREGALEDVAADSGQTLPATYRVRTRKGWHWYFDATEHPDLGNSPGRLAEYGCDVRGGGSAHGGYVVAAGSTHESGHVYVAEDEHVAPAPLPTWLAELIGRDRSRLSPAAPLPSTSRLKVPARTFTLGQAKRYVQDEALARVRAAVFGRNVNAALNDAACVAGHFVPAFWDEDTLVDEIRKALIDEGPGEALGWTDLDATDLRTIRSGLRLGMAQPYVLIDEPTATAEVTDERPTSSWVPLDLTPYLRGEVRRPSLACGVCRDDGLRFLYPGKEHSVIGEMESGKSWFALACVAAELLAGNVVVYIHFEEEDPTDTIERLLALGVKSISIELRFMFVGPAAPIADEDVERLTGYSPSLVVLDGVNEAMALHGQGIREEDGAAAFRAALVKPFTRAGAAVVSLDHVVKDPEKRGGYALGSIHKGNGLSGALIVLENAEPFGRGRRGRSGVYVTKDRPGELRRNGEPTRTPRKFYMGEMVVDAEHEGLVFSVYAPKPDGQVKLVGQADTETAVLAAVEAVIAAGQIATTAKIEAAAPLRAAKVRSALESLTLGGHLIETRGARNARVFTPLAMASTGPETTSSQDQTA